MAGEGLRVVGVVVAALVTATLTVAPSAGAAASPPAKWDPRVTKYVRFVERHRKLTFDHPVPVKFLADKAFVKAYQGDDPKVSKHDRADAERYAGQLRALGLIEGPVDLIQSQRDLGAADVVGFYDQHEHALFVRGEDLDDTDVRVTLVHELTHALQDQKFDLDVLDRQAETSGESFAETALVEGDATSVENEYVASLPRAEQDTYDASFDDQSPQPDAPSTQHVPPVLELFESAPYIFGPQYLDTLKAEGGLAQVDTAFRHPPHSEEEIIDAVAAKRGGRPWAVAVPKLGKGEKRDGAADDFGALSLYFVLASRLPPTTALRAAEGWGGDRYLAFTRGGERQECVRVAFRGDSGADTDQIGTALDRLGCVAAGGGGDGPPGGWGTDADRLRHRGHDRARPADARHRGRDAGEPQRARPRVRRRPRTGRRRPVCRRPAGRRPGGRAPLQQGDVDRRGADARPRPHHPGHRSLPRPMTG